MKTLAVALMLLMTTPAFGADTCDAALAQWLAKMQGQWRVEKQGRIIGELTLRVGAGGCALREEWNAADGTQAAALHWLETGDDGAPALRQVYVEDNGWVMHATGNIKDGVLVYRGESVLGAGNVTLRATIHGLGSDTLVHIADISKDEGASWQRVSTLHYRRVTDAS